MLPYIHFVGENNAVQSEEYAKGIFSTKIKYLSKQVEEISENRLQMCAQFNCISFVEWTNRQMEKCKYF